jgi:hypothetical protein
MEWLEPSLRNPAYGLIALAIGGAVLAPAVLTTLMLAWFSWRASRLARLARRFRGRSQLAEEQISSFAAEESDLRRMMKEIEKAQAKA